jgi:hypothetical protein
VASLDLKALLAASAIRDASVDAALEVASRRALRTPEEPLAVEHLLKTLPRGARPWEVELAREALVLCQDGGDRARSRALAAALGRAKEAGQDLPGGAGEALGEDEAAHIDSAASSTPAPRAHLELGSAREALTTTTEVDPAAEVLGQVRVEDLEAAAAALFEREEEWLLLLVQTCGDVRRTPWARPGANVRMRGLLAALPDGVVAAVAAEPELAHLRTAAHLVAPHLVAPLSWEEAQSSPGGTLRFMAGKLASQPGAWEAWGALAWDWRGTCDDLGESALALSQG